MSSPRITSNLQRYDPWLRNLAALARVGRRALADARAGLGSRECGTARAVAERRSATDGLGSVGRQSRRGREPAVRPPRSRDNGCVPASNAVGTAKGCRFGHLHTPPAGLALTIRIDIVERQDPTGSGVTPRCVRAGERRGGGTPTYYLASRADCGWGLGAVRRRARQALERSARPEGCSPILLRHFGVG